MLSKAIKDIKRRQKEETPPIWKHISKWSGALSNGALAAGTTLAAIAITGGAAIPVALITWLCIGGAAALGIQQFSKAVTPKDRIANLFSRKRKDEAKSN